MNLFVWNPGLMTIYLVAALLIWLLAQIRQARDKFSHPKLLGVAVCIVSGFDLGLYLFIPLALFLFLTWLIETWLGTILKQEQPPKIKVAK